jgi:FtsZ-interacting cell division protein YlmF
VLEFKPRTAAAVSAENLTDEEFNARLRERRENRIAEARAREEARAAARAAEDEAHREHVAAVAAATPEVVVDEKADVLKPGRPVPCLALRPRSYDDVHQIVQCVKGEGRPCVLVMGGCTAELGQRILDFTFGLCCGTGAEFCTLNGFSKVYGAFPKGTTLAEADKTGLARMGIQIRG